MPKRTRVVIGGVDTHGRTHHAAVIDQQGRLLGDREFPADSGGYRQLLGWLRRHGNPDVLVDGHAGSSSHAPSAAASRVRARNTRLATVPTGAPVMAATS